MACKIKENIVKKIFFFLMGIFPIFTFSAVSSTWSDTTGSWSIPANWTPPSVPQSTGDTAAFPVSVALQTITVDIPLSIGTFNVNDGYNFSFGGSGSFNFNTLPSSTITINTVNNSASFASNLPIQISALTQFTISTSNLSYSTQIAGSITGGATLSSMISNGTGSLTMSGMISNGVGALSITQSGTGTLTLSNNNTFSGGTTVSAGKLVIGNASSLGTGTFTINGGTFDLNGLQPVLRNLTGSGGTINSSVAGAILNINNSTPTSYSGTITSDLSLVLQAGILTLSGSNSYTGSTTITAGTLKDGTDNAVSTGSALIMNNGTLDLNGHNQTFSSLSGPAGNITSSSPGVCTLTINGPAVTNYSGTITNGSGTIALIKNGTGTQTLSGSNSYTGSTTIIAGTLQDGADNAVSTGSLIMNNGTLDLNGHNQTFSSLSGPAGNITSSSPGVCTLTINGPAVTNYAGTITNGSGTIALIKNGTGTQTLSGVNSIGTALVAGGFLVINNSFTCPGGLTVNAGSTLKGSGPIIAGIGLSGVNISGILAPGNSIGTINITGDLTFNSGSELQNEINPTTSDQVNVSGNLTINPNSSLVIVADSGFYSSTTYLIATANSLSGTFSTVTLPSFVLAAPLFFHMNLIYSSNQILLNLQRTPFADFFPSGNAGAVASCLDSLAPTATDDLADVINSILSLNTIDQVGQALFQLQPSLFTALAVVQENNTIFMRNILSHHMEDFFRCCNKKEGITLWVTPLGASVQQKRHKQEAGYCANTAGFFLGFDNYFNEASSAGIGIGYDRNHLHWHQKGSFADTDSVYFTLYGQWGVPHAYLEGGMIGGYNSYKTNRHIQFGPNIDRHAKGDHAGAEGAGYLQLGVIITNSSRWFLCPFATVDYLYIREFVFKEKGAQSLNLHIDEKSSDLLSTEGGLDFRYCAQKNHHAFKPYLQLSIIRENRFFGEHEDARLYDSCPMNITGYYPSRTLRGVSLGMNWTAPRGEITFSYQGAFHSHYKNNSVYLEFTLYGPKYQPPQRSHYYRNR